MSHGTARETCREAARECLSNGHVHEGESPEMGISSILVFILVGLVPLMVLTMAEVVLVIIASVKAGNGESYRYPFTIRFIK